MCRVLLKITLGALAAAIVAALVFLMLLRAETDQFLVEVQRLADADFRQHLVDTGQLSPELMKTLVFSKTPQEYFDAARKKLRP